MRSDVGRSFGFETRWALRAHAAVSSRSISHRPARSITLWKPLCERTIRTYVALADKRIAEICRAQRTEVFALALVRVTRIYGGVSTSWMPLSCRPMAIVKQVFRLRQPGA
jgi:hypothetical protein